MTLALMTAATLLSAGTSAQDPGTSPRTWRIPMRFTGNQIRLDATINGSGPFHLVLDTGMPIPGVLLLESERVSGLHLESGGQRVRVAGAGDEDASKEALMASGVSVEMGDWKLEKSSALVVPRPRGFPPGMDGVIGGALFFDYVVRIDRENERLDLLQPGTWTPPEGASIVPLDRQGGMIFTDVKVAVGAEEPSVAHVVIDIGAGHAISLNAREDGRFAPPAGSIDSPLGRGMNGVVLGKSGRLRRLELGSFAFENVVAAFPLEKHQRPGGADFKDGNLGEEILKRFTVTFDYAGKRMALEKGKGFDEAFEHEMLGCSLEWEDDGSVTVHDVMPNTPAASAGFADGDHVLSIDGRGVDAIGETGLRKALIVDGAEVRIALKRGTVTLETRVRLKRLV
jgi:hypothetical protein